MLTDDNICKISIRNDLERKLHRSIQNGDDETFVETYLKIVDEEPDLYDMLSSICEVFNQFSISVKEES